MEEKKKSTGSIVFIVLLILIILGLVGYICYDKGLLTKKEVTKEKTSNVEKISFKEAREVLDTFGINYLSVKDYTKSGFYFEYLRGNLDTKEEYTCEQITKKSGTKWTKDESYYQSDDGYICTTKVKYPVYSYEDMNKIYKQVYNKELKKESFTIDGLGNCNLEIYYYIKSIDRFVKIYVVGGCTTSPYEPVDIDLIDDAKIENNILTINAYIDYFEREDLAITKKGFKVYDEKVENELYNEDSDETDEYEMNIQYNTDIIRDIILAEYLDKVNKYEITFKVDVNKYTFDNIKKVN